MTSAAPTGVVPDPAADTAPASTGRSVLVTGGSRGIGAAIASHLHAAGHRVAVVSPSGRGPDGTLALAADLRSAGELAAAFSAAESAHGPVTGLVANAGITRDQLLLRMTEEDFADVVDVNLTGAYRVAKLAARSMLRARTGRIVFVGSVVGLSGAPGQANYAASKAGLVGLARSLAHELGSRSITANVVAPGWIDTDMTADVSAERRAGVLAACPLGRTGTAAEVAAAVAFLLSDPAGYITGAVLPVDGGLGLGH